MKSLRSLALVSALVLIGCSSKAPQPEPAQLSCSLADACADSASILLESGRPIDARRHLERSLRLEPNHQRSHVFLGVAYSRLGRADLARVHFEKAQQISPGTIYAQRASRWIDRLSHPTRLGLVNFSVPDDVEPYNLEQRLTETLSARLFESGLYQVQQLQHYGRNLPDAQEICQQAAEEDLEMVLIGTASRGTIHEGRERSLVDVLEDRRGTRYYVYELSLAAHLYRVDECTLEAVRRVAARSGKHTEDDAAVRSGVTEAVEQLARRLHAALY